MEKASDMKINLWYATEMKKWRWTLTDDDNHSLMESGQREFLKDAMLDVANTVDYVLDCKQSE